MKLGLFLDFPLPASAELIFHIQPSLHLKYTIALVSQSQPRYLFGSFTYGPAIGWTQCKEISL